MSDADHNIIEGAAIVCMGCQGTLLLDTNVAVAYAEMLTFTEAHAECPNFTLTLQIPPLNDGQ
jgi:hypothetical protein